ncbi:YdeI/OmpD-associated family protein [Jiangella asiatica]|uniref:OmdA domain containing protein n=1 Tax=Jiangella asiatica TaxID=2530372 RepID=A0A4R5DGA8_9ACTN|nr:YdeI/OmpD-associated family protein [Jiangella asiatica]TDE09433.1 OmdA domain containing protein [Jiangella asiatica]
MTTPDFLVVDAAGWEHWLAEHHATSTGVFVRIAKKGAPEPSLTIREALEAALCFGWIDSVRRSLDEHHYLQRYSPRRRGSAWSRVNVEMVQALTAAGRMRPTGLAQVEAARADGRWEAAYAPQREATVPSDLAAALAADPAAAAAFEALGRTDRYAVMLPVLKARTPAARATRVAQAVAALRGGGSTGP